MHGYHLLSQLHASGKGAIAQSEVVGLTQEPFGLNLFITWTDESSSVLLTLNSARNLHESLLRVYFQYSPLKFFYG